MTKKTKTILLMLLIVVLLVGTLFLGLFLGGAFRNETQETDAPKVADGSSYANTNDYADIEENPSITVPGFDSVYLTADQTHQYFTFNNPEENTCYFEIVLTMADGTELWRSDYLEPGMAISEFDLNQTLPAGIYENATVTYNCYSLKTLAPLNGGAITVSLVVE